jgi:hypothetical protein
MWDWHWQRPDDHGERYDLGLLEIHPQLHYERFAPHNCRVPVEGWLGLLIKWSYDSKVLTRRDLPDPTEVVDQACWCAIGRTLGGLGTTGRLALTRGTIAACWAIEHSSDGEVVLVGFDNVLAGRTLPTSEAFSPHYRAAPGVATFLNYRPGVTKAGNHDLAVERPLLALLARKRGIVLSFAQEAWSCPSLDD